MELDFKYRLIMAIILFFLIIDTIVLVALSNRADKIGEATVSSQKAILTLQKIHLGETR